MLKENDFLFNLSSLCSALPDVKNLVRSNSIRLDIVIGDIHVMLTDLKQVKPIISLLPIFTEEIPHPNLVLFLSEI